MATCYVQGFMAYFYSKQYKEAESCISKIVSYSSKNLGKFRKSRYHYYQANLYFAQGKFKECLEILREPMEIEKDKTRWNTGIRILKTMVFVEMGKLNEASRSLESLRKFVERTQKKEEIKKRDLLILKLFKEFEKNNFQFNAQNPIINGLIEQLSESKGELAWMHYTPELIPFQEWVSRFRAPAPLKKAHLRSQMA
jgi:tetratricopeptide (TPR) repeat protein